MKQELLKVLEFQQAFNQQWSAKPTQLNPSGINFRYNLIKEELEEYRQSAEAHDTVGVLDALADILYVVYGTAVTHGLQDILPAVFDEVHRSNMTKLGADGKPVYKEYNGTRKVAKSELYEAPNIEGILEEYIAKDTLESECK